MVGAVVVRDGATIGEGFHARLGGVHAEVGALEDCRARGEDPAGATMYVTLEPCAHHGRQPPCVDAIVQAGLGRVVIGCEDPSGKASGRGPGALRDEGIEVAFAEGAEATAARLLNQAFRKHARTGRPLVTLKSAVTLDGRVATPDGGSKWISGEPSRALVHRWRAETDAIAVGIGTASADDPLLTARTAGSEPARQPRRVVFDSSARLALDSALVGSIADAPLVLVTSPGADPARLAALRDAGAETIIVDGSPLERVGAALSELGRREVTSLTARGRPHARGLLPRRRRDRRASPLRGPAAARRRPRAPRGLGAVDRGRRSRPGDRVGADRRGPARAGEIEGVVMIWGAPGGRRGGRGGGAPGPSGGRNPMFTGLVADVGEIERADAGGDGTRMRIRTALAAELEPGDSIAVNGACLTAAGVEDRAFEADVMNNTLEHTSLGPLSEGGRVNLELPLRLSDRLGGHIVQGHVDGTGTVSAVAEDGFASRVTIDAPPELLRYVLERGSIAVDGVSLTVSALFETGFEVSLIPETLERTTLGKAQVGTVVNLELDVVARYVERLVSGSGS